VDLLSEAGRHEDAEVAANTAFTRFGQPRFALRRAELLAHLGRLPEAEAVAHDALAAATWIQSAVGPRPTHAGRGFCWPRTGSAADSCRLVMFCFVEISLTDDQGLQYRGTGALVFAALRRSGGRI